MNKEIRIQIDGLNSIELSEYGEYAVIICDDGSLAEGLGECYIKRPADARKIAEWLLEWAEENDK